MSSKKDTELLRELWSPFFIPGAADRSQSVLNVLAPRPCLAKEFSTLEDIVRCVESEGKLNSCLQTTLKKITDDWTDLSPEARSHISTLAEKYPSRFRDIPEVPAGDVARLRMPWHIADALYDNRRKQAFEELAKMGLDLTSLCFVPSRTHGIGNVEIELPGKLDTLLAAKLDIDLAAVVLTEPSFRKDIEKDIHSRADVETQDWYNRIHAAWTDKKMVLPPWVLSELDAHFTKRLREISSMQPSLESLSTFRELLPDPEPPDRPELPPTRYEMFVRWAQNNLFIVVVIVIVAVVAAVGGAFDVATKSMTTIHKYLHPEIAPTQKGSSNPAPNPHDEVQQPSKGPAPPIHDREADASKQQSSDQWERQGDKAAKAAIEEEIRIRKPDYSPTYTATENPSTPFQRIDQSWTEARHAWNIALEQSADANRVSRLNEKIGPRVHLTCSDQEVENVYCFPNGTDSDVLEKSGQRETATVPRQ